MARPRKNRKICKMPKVNFYGPMGKKDDLETIILSVEGYESIRLMDYEGMTQAECAKQMGVARTTLQRIYEEARNIVADGIVNGKIIHISGGNYELCRNKNNEECSNCRGRGHRNRFGGRNGH